MIERNDYVFQMVGLGAIEIAHMAGRYAHSIKRMINPPPPTKSKPYNPSSLLFDRDIRHMVNAAAFVYSPTTMAKNKLIISALVRTDQGTLARVDGWIISN